MVATICRRTAIIHGMTRIELIERDLSEKVIGAFYEVYNALGFGFLEAAYRKAMAVHLTSRGIVVAQEVPFELTHLGVPIGHYRADLIVEQRIVVEAKTGSTLDAFAAAQVINYLKVSGLSVGLILHFGPKPSFKRVVATRHFRSSNSGADHADDANRT